MRTGILKNKNNKAYSTINGNLPDENGNFVINAETVGLEEFEGLTPSTLPVSNDVQSALDEKQDLLTSEQIEDINSIPNKANAEDVFTKEEINTSLDGKQDTLVSGVNIKTINGNSILGTGNIAIEGGSGISDAPADGFQYARQDNSWTKVQGVDVSGLATKTEVEDGLNDKVDKVVGKGLSDNNFTTEEKTKLDGLSNYTLPQSTDSTLGGVKVGAGLNITADGSLSVENVFEPNNYYTKTENDTLLNSKANSVDVYTKTESDSLLNAKADANNVYTKSEADGLLDTKANSTNVYTKSESDTLLSNKADANNVYTKTESNGLLNEKADADNVYTKSEVDNITNNIIESVGKAVEYKGSVENKAALDEIVDKENGDMYTALDTKTEWLWDGTNWIDIGGVVDLSAYALKTDVYTKTESNGLLNDKANAIDVYTKTESDNLLNTKANATNVYTKAESDNLLSAKANSVDVYNKTESDSLLNDKVSLAEFGLLDQTISATLEEHAEALDSLQTNKQDKLFSGTNIKTIGGESVLGSGNIAAVVDANYVHTDNNFTTEEKTKLETLQNYTAGDGIAIENGVINSTNRVEMITATKPYYFNFEESFSIPYEKKEGIPIVEIYESHNHVDVANADNILQTVGRIDGIYIDGALASIMPNTTTQDSVLMPTTTTITSNGHTVPNVSSELIIIAQEKLINLAELVVNNPIIASGSTTARYAYSLSTDPTSTLFGVGSGKLQSAVDPLDETTFFDNLHELIEYAKLNTYYTPEDSGGFNTIRIHARYGNPGNLHETETIATFYNSEDFGIIFMQFDIDSTKQCSGFYSTTSNKNPIYKIFVNDIEAVNTYVGYVKEDGTVGLKFYDNSGAGGANELWNDPNIEKLTADELTTVNFEETGISGAAYVAIYLENPKEPYIMTSYRRLLEASENPYLEKIETYRGFSIKVYNDRIDVYNDSYTSGIFNDTVFSIVK